jgi:hypothetical protein
VGISPGGCSAGTSAGGRRRTSAGGAPRDLRWWLRVLNHLICCSKFCCRLCGHGLLGGPLARRTGSRLASGTPAVLAGALLVAALFGRGLFAGTSGTESEAASWTATVSITGAPAAPPGGPAARTAARRLRGGVSAVVGSAAPGGWFVVSGSLSSIRTSSAAMTRA